MDVVECILFLSTLIALWSQGNSDKGKCEICKNIITNFKKGLEDTKKSNFGGGNTAWEEKSLGSYQYSETRLVEIMEKMCDSEGKESTCHGMVEEFEEQIENFWFKHFSKNKDTDFQKYLCIDRMKVCCNNFTWGPKCEPCIGGTDSPCSGKGSCDGAGTREGTGKCKCDSGYKGDICDQCSEGYYEEEKNETNLQCTACHESCKDTCTEGGPKGCDECKEGWKETNSTCTDVDECTIKEIPCSENQFCTNTEGSYTCTDCNIACDKCGGSGPEDCIQCKEGFSNINNTCIDNNECEQDGQPAPGPPCSKENEECINNPGSFSCECVSGFDRMEDQCVAKPPEPEPSENKDKENGVKNIKTKKSNKKDEEDEDTDSDTEDDTDDETSHNGLDNPYLPPPVHAEL